MINTPTVSGEPGQAPTHEFGDVQRRDLRGLWEPVEINGRRVRVLTGQFGYLVVGGGEVSTQRGCQWYRAPLRVRPNGIVDIDLTHTPTGCPVWTGRNGLGPNTVRILRDSVHWQRDAHRLTMYGVGDRKLGVYRKLTNQERYDLIHD